MNEPLELSTVLDGGCSSRFDPTADVTHKTMRLLFAFNGYVPGKT
jgi:hypothetical protein